MQHLHQKLKAHLAKADATHLLRTRTYHAANLLSFSENDYLGLAKDKALSQAYQKSFEQYAQGSTGSALISGYHAPHLALEKAFANALTTEDALLFSSGYAANLSVMQLLGALKCHALIDKQCHASCYDGLKLGEVNYTRYLHQNMKDFQKKALATPKDTLVITESIFSMSGHQPELTLLAEKYPLIVDEAHAFGVLGEQGLGAVHAEKLPLAKVPLRIIPCGKALGSHGAIVAGSKLWIDALLQSARPLIYSTAVSPALAHGLLHAFERLKKSEDKRAQLQENITYFKQCAADSPLTFGVSSSPIQQLKLGCPKKAILYSDFLKRQGILCLPMRPPTVTTKNTGLRMVLTALHTKEHINKLFKGLELCHASI